MKRIALMCIVFLFVARALSVGCTSVFNPSPSPRPDYSAYFASRVERLGWAPVNPISETADNVYSGSYRNGTRSDQTFNITIEIAKSETAAEERYGQLVAAKQNEGYINQQSGIDLGNSPFWDVKALWVGHQPNSLVSAPTYTKLTYVFMYGYDMEISEWVVVTFFTDIVLET